MPTNNFPTQATAFVGRTSELAEIAQRLVDPACRLLTLVGPGGIGKTRLALQAAAEQVANFDDGAHFVGLASVGSAHLLPAAIAGALTISFYGPEDPAVQIVNYLRDKHILLVLDNFEHLLEGIRLLVDLLAHTSDVKLLVTSRERLSLQEEWVLPVHGMHYPNSQYSVDVEQYSAIRLFVQSARRVQPDFAAGEDIPAIIGICQQVEGMPLGLELAATWLRVMSCQQVCIQLEQSLDFLTTPMRNVPERHRSLRAVFDQSWKLLSEPECSVLMKLSVFRGGLDLEAAQQIAGARLPILAGLIDKSLLRVSRADRYDLHELLRQFAADKLAEVGEAAGTANRHLSYFLSLAEQAEVESCGGPKQIAWLDRLEIEHDNLRAALDWTLSDGKADIGLRLAVASSWFWGWRAHWHEGREWLAKLLAVSGTAPSSVRATALRHAAFIECWLTVYVQGERFGVEALQLARAANDKRNIAWSLAVLGLAHFANGALEDAVGELEDALTRFREIGDECGIGNALLNLGLTRLAIGDHERAIVLSQETLALGRAMQDKGAMAWALLTEGLAEWHRAKDLSKAASVLRESLFLLREIGQPIAHMATLIALGGVMLDRENDAQARTYYEECLTEAQEIDQKRNIANCLVGIGLLILKKGRSLQAATLLGAADAALEAELWNRTILAVDRQLAEVRPQLDDMALAAWAEGRTMTLEQAVTLALHQLEPETVKSTETTQSQRDTGQTLPQPLSIREMEVLRLVAEGLSNAEIGARLFLSPGTIKAHTRSIYSKLSVNSRTQAVTQAQKLQLL